MELVSFTPEVAASISGAPDSIKITSIKKSPISLIKKTVNPFRSFIVKDYSPDIAEALRSRSGTETLLWISRLSMAKYIPLAHKYGYKIVLDQHSVESNFKIVAPILSAKNLSSVFKEAQLAYYTSKFGEKADAIVATNLIDASRFAKAVPDKPVHIIANSVDCARFRGLRKTEGKTLLFAGDFRDQEIRAGLEWFENKILPRLRSALGTKLPEFRKVDFKRTEDILPSLEDAKIVLVPIRAGRSNRLLIVEAMAAGKPIVTTAKGAEGMALSPSYDVWITETTNGFTSAIVQLLEDDQLRRDLGAHAAETAESRYDWSKTRLMMNELLKSITDSNPNRE